MAASHRPTHKEIYTYTAPWPVYGLHWSQRPGAFRLGIASLTETNSNKLQVIQLFNKGGDFVKIAEADHSLPVTKFMWSPFHGMGPDLFATSGDYLRLWELVTPDEAMDTGLLESSPGSGGPPGTASLNAAASAASGAGAAGGGGGGVGGGGGGGGHPPSVSSNSTSSGGGYIGTPAVEQRPIICRATLANVRRVGQQEYCAPLTSFDWNETDPSLCVTSSIDTTCTVWDVETQQAKTQLIAHDKEVFDVAFSKGVNVFASVGADGSVRMFDLRSLEHSTIIYETPAATPQGIASAATPGHPSLLRLAWNKQDPSYLATFQQDTNAVLILDIRVPAIPVTELHGHASAVTAIGWAPHSSGHICTTGEDAQALVWDISQMSTLKHIQDPLLAYTADSEINQMSWSKTSPEWIAISHGNSVQALKV
ncbi:WD40-repeat-containing domain protein [Entophlyctis helioformis]|nr:WD40-repeat-containing domain protein [Entophlyctis helioformis]